jgi:hypothetical protein
MAITRIGTSAIEGTTITIPGTYQAGDIILIYAYRSATTAPSLPAGWTNIGTASAGATSYRLGWKLAASASETSGTWTNATGLVCWVGRGISTSKTPVGNSTGNTGTTATPNFGTNTLLSNGGSWIVAFAANHSTTSTLETPPTGMVNRVDLVGVADEYVCHDTNGVYDGNWPATTVNATVSAEYRSANVEIRSEAGLDNNHQFMKVGDGISMSERIR